MIYIVNCFLSERSLRKQSSGKDEDDFFSCVTDKPRRTKETSATQRARFWVRKKYMMKERTDDSQEAQRCQSGGTIPVQNGTQHYHHEHRRRSESKGPCVEERLRDTRHHRHQSRRRSKSRGPVVDEGPRDMYQDYHEHRRRSRKRNASADERHSHLRSDRTGRSYRQAHRGKGKRTDQKEETGSTTKTKEKKTKATKVSRKQTSSTVSMDSDHRSTRKQGGTTALTKLRSRLRSAANGLRSLFLCTTCSSWE